MDSPSVSLLSGVDYQWKRINKETSSSLERNFGVLLEQKEKKSHVALEETLEHCENLWDFASKIYLKKFTKQFSFYSYNLYWNFKLIFHGN